MAKPLEITVSVQTGTQEIEDYLSAMGFDVSSAGGGSFEYSGKLPPKITMKKLQKALEEIMKKMVSIHAYEDE